MSMRDDLIAAGGCFNPLDYDESAEQSRLIVEAREAVERETAAMRERTAGLERGSREYYKAVFGGGMDGVVDEVQDEIDALFADCLPDSERVAAEVAEHERYAAAVGLPSGLVPWRV